jgi:sterol desaturase/sphingolipid hydroxylase (fatty acid hydroxylase superfamily)
MSELPLLWQNLIAWVSSHGVTPILSALDWQDLGNPDEIAEAVVIAVLQLSIISLIFRPLESLVPAERWENRRLTRIDMQYTLIMLLGLFPLFSYLVLTPLSNYLGGSAGGAEESALHLTHWLPWLDSHPLLRFLLYYLVYDFAYYCLHRTQHLIPWWWAMHSMHHSQRQLSCWSNDRGCYLDGVIQSFILAGVALVMGVAPNEFALLILLSELMQNFSHTNVRIGFGRLENIFVDPRFHRLHHMQVDPSRPGLHNCNFGQVFSIWDKLFGTALFGEAVRQTGVGDPMVDADNGRGLIIQQWETLKRFWGAFRRPAGWRPGDVSFSPDYKPIPSDHLESHTAVAASTGAVSDT